MCVFRGGSKVIYARENSTASIVSTAGTALKLRIATVKPCPALVTIASTSDLKGLSFLNFQPHPSLVTPEAFALRLGRQTLQALTHTCGKLTNKEVSI